MPVRIGQDDIALSFVRLTRFVWLHRVALWY